MSRRKRPKGQKIELLLGKFYNVHDGSRSGHPGRIEKINKNEDEYLSVTTGSMSEEEYNAKPFRKDYKELKHTTSPDVYKSFINKKPFIGARDDYGNTEYTNMSFYKDDYDKIKIIKQKKPREGYWFKKKKKKPSQ